MKKTEEQIQKKREEKYAQLEYKTKKQTEQKIIKFQEESSAQIEYKTAKIKKNQILFLQKRRLSMRERWRMNSDNSKGNLRENISKKNGQEIKSSSLL